MSRSKTILIGTGVLILGLAGIFVISVSGNRAAQSESEPVTAAEESPVISGGGPMDAPVMKAAGGPMDAPVMEAANGIMPGMAVEESYLAKSDWVSNPDGTVTYKGNRYKRNAHVKAILLAGIDQKHDMHSKTVTGYAGAADGLMLVAQDTSRNSLKMVMIPRDSMLDILMTSEDGEIFTVFTHLTLAFLNGDGRDSSARSLVKATSDLLCGLEINHYLVGDLSLLAEVNDMVGGVTVTIPNDELVKKNPEWIRGKQVTLHGDEAEAFIRYRDIEVDATPLLRMSQHREYISGFYRALRETSRQDSAIVSKLVDRIDTSVVTDMSKGEYEKIALDGLQGGFNPDEDITSLQGTAKVGEEDGTMYDQVYLDYTCTIPLLLDLFYRKIE